MFKTSEQIYSNITSMSIAELFWKAQTQGGILSKGNITESNINPMAIDKLLENKTLSKIYPNLDLYEFSLSLGTKNSKLFAAHLLAEDGFITGLSVLSYYDLINIELDTVELGVISSIDVPHNNILPNFINVTNYEDEIFDDVEYISVDGVEIPMLSLATVLKEMIIEDYNIPTVGSAIVHALMQGHLDIPDYQDIKIFIEDVESFSVFKDYLEVADDVVESLNKLNKILAF